MREYREGEHLPTLLIVDDDPAVRDVLREFVGLCCPQIVLVAEATNGQEAVDLAAELQPDVILMDIRMPILDGLAATRVIKQELNCPSVIITFTSFTWPELEREAKAAGAQYHLSKPFELEQLGKTLTEAAGLCDE